MAEDNLPRIASVIPVLNEQDSIIDCLESLCNQTIANESHLIYVLDGGSTDSTTQVIQDFIDQMGQKSPEIILLNNPGKHVAEARNLALSKMPKSIHYMLEVIGHCTLDPGHIQIVVEEFDKLQRENDSKIGALGVKVESKEGPLGLSESWIEASLSSPLGSSNGQFDNFSGTQRTNVPAFCLHSRLAVEEVGGWDTEFITSQDSDLSMRLIKSGYALFRTDLTTVKMTKRTSLNSWFKMGFRYGFWRTKVVKKHPERASLREFMPWFGLILTTMLFLLGLDIWYIPPLAYGLAITLEGLRNTIVKRKLSLLVGLPLSLFILHVSFSLGLVYGLFGKSRSFNDRDSRNGNIQ